MGKIESQDRIDITRALNPESSDRNGDIGPPLFKLPVVTQDPRLPFHHPDSQGTKLDSA